MYNWYIYHVNSCNDVPDWQEQTYAHLYQCKFFHALKFLCGDFPRLPKPVWHIGLRRYKEGSQWLTWKSSLKRVWTCRICHVSFHLALKSLCIRTILFWPSNLTVNFTLITTITVLLEFVFVQLKVVASTAHTNSASARISGQVGQGN